MHREGLPTSTSSANCYREQNRTTNWRTLMGLFSNEEMTRRLENARRVMAEKNIDAIVINSVHNTLYYSGFWMVPWGRYQGVVIPREGEPAVIAP